MLGSSDKAAGLEILGLGFAHEKATIDSKDPLRAEGLTEAIRRALAQAGLAMKDVSYRLTDLNGEHYKFKEAAFAFGRLLRVPLADAIDLWHPIEYVDATLVQRSARVRSRLLCMQLERALLPVILSSVTLATTMVNVPRSWLGSFPTLPKVSRHAEAQEESLSGEERVCERIEVSAKADDNQSIAAMPDSVCLSPPSPPAGPTPIPYPNFSNASDTTNGTRTVKIGG